jgi:NADPH2:quinone reductase
MRAVAISKFGGIDTLKVTDIPKPSPAQGELLVKVFACGVNPVDYKIRQGHLNMPFTFPLVLGYDVSGVVEAVGEGVEDFEPGDEVFYSPELLTQGAYAEYHVVNESIVALKPEGYSHVEAASVPLAGCTAWQALFDRAAVQSGDVVLIHAAAGGVGSAALQLASWAGCEVIATASRENRAFLEELGADMVIDYLASDFVHSVMDATAGEGVDVVMDNVGGEVFVRSFEALAQNGCVVSIVPEGFGNLPLESLVPAFFKNAQAHFHFMQRDRAALDSLARLMERGYLDPVVEEVLPLEDVAKAHERLETGHGRGKIVLEIVEE